MPNLTIREKGAETVFQVSETAATIGRGEYNDVRVQDPRASKEHCQIVEQDGRWKLVDLESHNGTRVNGAFRNKAWLGHGDTITIGQSEIRFGLEGKTRARTAPARRDAEEGAEEGAPPPPRRYRSGSGGEKLLIYGGALLGLVLVIAFVMQISKGMAPDEHNQRVSDAAERLVDNGQYDEAQRYIMENADSSGNLYGKLMERVRELESRKPEMQRAKREREAHTLLSRMANKIANYNRGGSAEPAVILRMMKQLKTEYAGTEQDLAAAQTYPEFYAGSVPEPSVNRSNPLRKLKKEWAEVCEQADGYRKQEHFREARETLERFVRVRESTLEQIDLDWLNTELTKRVGNIERLAGTYFSSTERRARDLVKKKRYDQAIALY
ncbi:MAG: FHA domain-containing protein, partial [Planctomycetota bacterium]